MINYLCTNIRRKAVEVNVNPAFSNRFDESIGRGYAIDINIHWAYTGSKGYTTGFDSNNNPCSTDYPLEHGNKKEYQEEFINILDSEEVIGVTIIRPNNE